MYFYPCWHKHFRPSGLARGGAQRTRERQGPCPSEARGEGVTMRGEPFREPGGAGAPRRATAQPSLPTQERHAARELRGGRAASTAAGRAQLSEGERQRPQAERLGAAPRAEQGPSTFTPSFTARLLGASAAGLRPHGRGRESAAEGPAGAKREGNRTEAREGGRRPTAEPRETRAKEAAPEGRTNTAAAQRPSPLSRVAGPWKEGSPRPPGPRPRAAEGRPTDARDYALRPRRRDGYGARRGRKGRGGREAAPAPGVAIIVREEGRSGAAKGRGPRRGASPTTARTLRASR